MSESRYKSLKAKNPEAAEALFKEAAKHAQEKYEYLVKLAKND